MMMNGPGGDGPEEKAGAEPSAEPIETPQDDGKRKAVGKIALKKKQSKPPWGFDLDVREVGPETLTPVERDKSK